MSRTSDDIIAVPTTVEQSVLYRGLRSLAGKVRAATRDSWLTRSVAALSRWTRRSWLYRWLTKEPEPEVIVIDLRETWTVAPIIAVLDWVIDGFLRAYADSRMERLVTAVGEGLYRAPIRYVSAGILAGVLVAAVVGHLAGGLSRLSLIGFGGLAVVAVVGLFVETSWPTLRESKPVQLLIAAFEPPEPPESEE